MTSNLPARRRKRKPLTRARREQLLEYLREGRTLTSAAKAVASDRRRVWELARDDPDFAAELEEATNEGIDHLEDELVRAATEGWEETDIVEKAGVITSRITKQRKDPRLLAKVREWRRPPVDVSVNVSAAPVEIEGRPAVGWSDLFAVARAAGAEHLLGFVPAEDGETIDAEPVEIPEPAALPPAATESHVPAPPVPDAAPPAMTLQELADVLGDSRDAYTDRPLDLSGGSR